jgi:serine/threonine-protein kinase
MLTTGTVLQNRYRIVSSLGQGGMGVVYRAWDIRLKGPVALKEMIPQPGLDPYTLTQLRQQFEQEAVVLARLNHPYLVNVTDFFEEGGNDYLVMDFVEGESLADRIEREGALPEDQVLEWAKQLLDALGYCHAQGIIHRDVKPQNVIITPSPDARGGGRAVLVDFGLVKLWDPRDPRTKTAMRGMGTPEYAPPEQYSTQSGHTGPYSDLYSLGATLYHALTGQTPLTATDRMSDPDQFMAVRGWNRRVSPRTDAAVLRAMELPRGKRFQNAQEMTAALSGEAHVSDRLTTSKRQPTKVMQKTPPVARPKHSVPTWVWVLGIIVLVGGGIGLALPTGTLSPPPVTSAFTATPTQSMNATPLPSPTEEGLGDTWTRLADGMVMVYVPAGEFEMGGTEGKNDEQPMHTVALDGFWIDRTEVTNAQYERCVADGDCSLPGWAVSHTRDLYYGNNTYADYPVIYVRWTQAMNYCAWAGARLPTEAEWEYAARGTQEFIYPWGDEFDGTRLNYCDANCEFDWADKTVDDGYADTAPVGSYPGGASWCGTLDLAGNVWEWTADWYGDYHVGVQTNPLGQATGDHKVLRGASWGDNSSGVYCAVRLKHGTVYGSDHVGFRCARSSE